MTAVADRTLDFERCYRALASRDARFDGWFVVGVRSTGIYCRPSCPAIVPRRENVTFLRTAAAAQRSGFRACKRCRPDASPGSPEWNTRADVVGRAMRLIADGVIDREGVTGLARRLGYSGRQLQRHLTSELGAGPLAIARAHRAQTARLLIESTDLPLSQVGFAAGFASTRQFNATVREVFATTPGALRRRSRVSHDTAPPGEITLRLPARAPFDGPALLSFLGDRAVPGVEDYDGVAFRRALRLPQAAGVVALDVDSGGLRCRLRLDDLRDLGPAIQRCRRLADLDADPAGIAATLQDDTLLGPLVRRSPGRRVPGTTDGAEIAIRAVLGQQVSVAAARRLAGTLVSDVDDALANGDGAVTHLFPTAAAVRDAVDALPVPHERRDSVRRVAAALDDGTVTLDAGTDAGTAVGGLLALRGIGPWTAGYVAMRGLGDPDAFPTGDAAVRRSLCALGRATGREQAAAVERWRPWRAYAVMHLWAFRPEEEPR